MLGEPHNLSHEFPEFISLIDQKINSNPDFAVLSKQYHQLDDEIRQLELAGSPTSDHNMQDLKLTRVRLKDRLFAMLSR